MDEIKFDQILNDLIFTNSQINLIRSEKEKNSYKMLHADSEFKLIRLIQYRDFLIKNLIEITANKNKAIYSRADLLLV